MSVRHYFNEFDPFAAAWLRELMRGGHIPEGVVDERPIQEVRPSDLAGFRQCHFFAGIGGWPLALRLAGWPDARPVWTGSCPCQPFSSAGKRKGTADARHLWPEFRRLVAECRPATLFGEQVASKDGLAWLDGVRADLEGAGYAFGAADLCAAGVGAPHIRQRLFWVGDTPGERLPRDGPIARRASDGGCRQPRVPGKDGGLGDAVRDGPQRLNCPRPTPGAVERADGTGVGFWSAYDLIPYRDGKARRVEPGTFPLVDGLPGRVGLLRGYGNAIVPQTAAEFVAAFLEVEAEGGVS